MKTRYVCCWLACLMVIVGVGCSSSPEPVKTQLEIRQAQSREYELDDMMVAMKAVVNVLQDEGFIIKTADKDLGIINAVKEAEQGNIIEGFASTFGGIIGSEETWDKKSDVECAVNVSRFGKKIRVRANFRLSLKNILGGAVKKKDIEDPKFYQEFFAKVSKGIFLQRENL